jgi:hypothetical protein
VRTLCVLFLFASCAHAPTARVGDAPNVADIVASLAQRKGVVLAAEAETKIDYLGEHAQRVKLKVGITIARGGKLRLEADSPMGSSLATLVADGVNFGLIDLRENRFIVGAARACNIARFTRVAIDPGTIADLLLGDLPIIAATPTLAWDDGADRLDYTLSNGTLRAHVTKAAEGWRVRDAERRDADGKAIWRIENSDFAMNGGFAFPNKIYIADKKHDADMQIRVHSLTPNPTLAADTFQLKPSGLQAQQVTCEDN